MPANFNLLNSAGPNNKGIEFMKDSGFQEIINLTKELEIRGKELSAQKGRNPRSRSGDEALVSDEGAAEGDATRLREE